VPRDQPCCLCSQIQGESAHDLIAELLPGQAYVRRVLFETELFAAFPSLGPLTVGHSLLCPKSHTRSFAGIDSRFDSHLLAAKEELRGSLAQLYDSPVHIFEHGAAAEGARIPCTVDHAHLHFLPLPDRSGKEIRSCEQIISADGLWIGFTGSLPALRELVGRDEYIFYETPDGKSRVLRAGTSTLESQYMRKLFARWVGREGIWDWRSIPNAELADEAWRQFIRFRRCSSPQEAKRGAV
jgi:diadenosine tetraphosphate (Ap4A) HIT family hydrolase